MGRTDDIRGRQAVRVDNMWRHLIDTYGVYTSAEVALMRGNAPTNRAAATRLRERGLRRFQHGRNKVYPRFQFLDGDINPTWTRASHLLADAGWDDADVLLWMVAPHPLLEGREPAEFVTNPTRFLPVVEQEAAGAW